MSSAVPVLLFPNFGAEEGEPKALPAWSGRTVLPPLWAQLFAPPVALDGGVLPHERPSWFSDDGPAFSWLAPFGGLVPWLATGRAAERAASLGLALHGPDVDVAWRLSDKGWAHDAARALGWLPPEVHRSVLVLGPEDLADPVEARACIESHLASLTTFASGYTLKPRYGSSGRGRVPGRGVSLEAPAIAAFARLAARGGVMVEPWFPRTRDLSVQLLVTHAGVDLLGVTEQVLRGAGGYEGSRGIVCDAGIRSGTPFDDALVAVGQAMGQRARDEGFRGPCSIDAFAYESEAGETLRPVVEMNARFTMGTVALGVVERAMRAGMLTPGQGWHFGLCPPHGGYTALPGLTRVLPLEVGGAALALCEGGPAAQRRGSAGA